MPNACKSSLTLLRNVRPSSLATRRVRLPALQRTRSYFSIHHPNTPTFPETQDRILSAALARVPEYGFTDEALVLGCKDEGYLDVSVQLFPRGVLDLINYHLVTRRLRLKDDVQFPQGGQLGLGAKVRTLAMARLRANTDIIHQLQGALGYMSLLENIPASLQELFALSDEIWFLAGDTAVDFSWYTKRTSLAAVYATSELFMTTDSSKGFAATEEFLDRRLKDAQNVGGPLGGLSQYVGFWAGNSVNLARSWGMKI